MARIPMHTFTELGYFTENRCEAIRNRLQGKSFLKFDIGWSNYASNCTLIVGAGIETHADGSEITEEELVTMFLHVALNEIFELERELKTA